MTDVTKTSLPMVCVCSDDGKQAAYAARARVGEIMKLNDRMYQTMSSQIIYSLSFQFKKSWSIDTVYADMWMLVSISAYEDGEVISITCDLFEDGLVALWLHLYETEGFDE